MTGGRHGARATHCSSVSVDFPTCRALASYGRHRVAGTLGASASSLLRRVSAVDSNRSIAERLLWRLMEVRCAIKTASVGCCLPPPPHTSPPGNSLRPGRLFDFSRQPNIGDRDGLKEFNEGHNWKNLALPVIYIILTQAYIIGCIRQDVMRDIMPRTQCRIITAWFGHEFVSLFRRYSH